MILITNFVLFVQFLASIIFGWRLGVNKGLMVYLITFATIVAISSIFTGYFLIFLISLWLPFILISCVLGLLAGVKLRQGKKLIALALISPLIIYWASLVAIDVKKEHELKLVAEFVKSDKTVIQFAGENITIHPHGGGWMKPKSILPFKYEIPITGTNNSKKLYVFVDVFRSWPVGSPIFSLACISSLSPGSRDAIKDVCKQ
jgi:hypothetical protein